ncbi:ABC transporter permease [Prolixibacter bellariivorans]|uniref:ABC transporter permease n=1 Tax=Prolixibacter bellariivorans TaxID=314319 RepID=A0A5M4B208_9BACT|nr:FtsX-like permease family protein [Prolixibacter bellariivorans]GET34152.1 ABC transporter permease [Prolixibacter bellariivorans]
MHISNIKLAWRNLWRNKLVSAINILGITIGITSALLIFSFVRKEKSTDKYIPDCQNIYNLNNNGGSHLSQHMVNLVKQEIPEIKELTYCTNDWSPQIFFTNNHTTFQVDKQLVADSCFFRVFQFPAVYGDPAKTLNRANQVVITQSLSRKLFGNENPVGKSIIYNATYMQNTPIEVGAVIRDLPQNSSWDFQSVLSLQTNYKLDWYVENMEDWGTQNYRAFARLNKHVSAQTVEKKLAAIPMVGVPDYWKKNLHYGLTPFSQLYLNHPDVDILKHGNPLTVSIVQVIGILILLLACVNYINMVTAQREKRFKEVGIIKTLGSGKAQIIKLFITESGILLLISTLLSVFISLNMIGIFNSLTESKFTVPSIYSGWNLVILSVILLLILILTGIIPGLLFSRHRAVLLLKNQINQSRSNWFRNGLLVFQFTVSIALLAGIMLINRQNQYLDNSNPGFQRNHIIFANSNSNLGANMNAFRDELKQIPGITDIALSDEPIGYMSENWGRNLINNGKKEEVHFAKFTVSPNFFHFFGIKLKQGKTFNDNSSRNQDFIFNEKAIHDFGIKDISKAQIATSDPAKGRIIGTADNFNFESLHAPIRAAGFMCNSNYADVIYLKTDTQDRASFQQTMKSVKKIWDQLSPNFPFEYKFLNASWDALYRKDQQFQKILGITTLISLFLSCLGLIGMTFFIIEKRTKEIGIRKVNGAKVSEVMTLLNKDFIKWVAIAFLIATPIAYYAMNKWLENFAYKTSLSWWIFALAGVLALGIALLTVSWQSWKAATRNPVEALRYE